jgi:hypothetical protein
VIDLEPDEGALDDQQLALVALPGAAVLQPLVRPDPGPGLGVPYLEVSVTVVTGGSGKVAGSLKSSLRPCRGRRPPVDRGRAGSGGAGVPFPFWLVSAN